MEFPKSFRYADTILALYLIRQHEKEKPQFTLT